MANRSYDDRTPDGISNPLKGEDLIGVSNEDGGGGFNLSKKITITQVANFIRSLFGINGTAFTIPMYDTSGTSIEDGPLTSDGTHLKLVNNLTIGDDALDPTTKLYIYGQEDIRYVAWFENRFNEDDYAEGIFARASGANTDNAGGVFDGSNGTNSNIGVFARAEGGGIDTIITAMKLAGIDAASFVGSTSDLSGGIEGRATMYGNVLGDSSQDHFGSFYKVENGGTGNAFGLCSLVSADGAGTAYAAWLRDGTEGIGKVLTCITADGKAQWADPNPVIIGGVTLSSSSNTNILNGTYVILADTTTVTSVTSGIGQDSDWTLEVTQAGITNQKGVITFTGNLEKDAGGGANYDVAIFKNGSIVSESEQVDHKLESDGKGQSVTVMAIIEFSTSDTFDIRVAGNGTANDIFCGGGSLYIQ